MKVIREVWQEEDGIGVVEIILILVILIMIIAIFRKQIVDIIGKAFKQINSNASDVNSKIELKNNNSLYFRNSVEGICF